MYFKQLYCAVFRKHPSRQYARLEEIIKAEKDHQDLVMEACLRCGKVLKKKGN